jgi:hypothetical protein
MNMVDTIYCNKYVFIDSSFNVRIGPVFDLPCNFEPVFSEGLCAVVKDSQIVYIDTSGRIRIYTGLKACDREQNKVSTFRNGIATLYKANPEEPGKYISIAINRMGERVKLLDFEELDLASKWTEKFLNLQMNETENCFVGRGRSNGMWFLIDKSGKIIKKLDINLKFTMPPAEKNKLQPGKN